MAKQIYYLQSCDEYKSNHSMHLLFIGTSSQKLRNAIINEIENGNMEYEGGVEGFKKDWKKETRGSINSRLDYGYFDYTYNNEMM